VTKLNKDDLSRYEKMCEDVFFNWAVRAHAEKIQELLDRNPKTKAAFYQFANPGQKEKPHGQE